jgi:hypothetical protein
VQTTNSHPAAIEMRCSALSMAALAASSLSKRYFR